MAMFRKILLFLLFCFPVYATLPNYVAFTEAKSASNATSIQITTPSNTAIGDLLVAVIATDGDNSASLSGWTSIADKSNSTDSYCGVLYKVLTAAADADYTFSLTDSETIYAMMLHFNNVNYDNPIDVNDDAVGTTQYPQCPDVTTTVQDCLILRVFGADDDDATPDSGYPAGHTGISVDVSGNNGGPSGGAAYETQVAAGSPGTAQFDNQAIEEWVAHTIAITGVPDGNSKGGKVKPYRGSVLPQGKREAIGLIGYWPMLEGTGNTTYDMSGNRNNGTLTGTSPVWSVGILGHAISLPGTNEYVALGAIDIAESLSELTISIWAKNNAATPSTYESMIAQWGPADFNFQLWRIDSENIEFQMRTSTPSTVKGVYVDGIIDTDWHHVVGVFDGSNVEVYVDGIKGGTVGSKTDDTLTVNAQICIGAASNGSTQYWNGLIDNVQIYNRALSELEIRNIYSIPFSLHPAHNPILRKGDVAVTDAAQVIMIQISCIPFLVIAGVVLAFIVGDRKWQMR